MKTKNQIIFWLVILLILTMVFSSSLGSFVLGFYFVSLLFPVVLGTSIFFNQFLVPRFLLKGEIWKFAQYFSYMLIVSIYLELLVMILAFVILANYQIEDLGKIASDIYLLTITLYLIVFTDGFITTIRSLKLRNSQLEQLEKDRVRNTVSNILVKVNRKNIPINIANIALIESLSDYVKIHTLSKQYITKEKISSLQSSLPKSFLRIHRSFLVNQKHIESFNRENVTVLNQLLPIGRTYKKECLEILNTQVRIINPSA